MIEFYVDRNSVLIVRTPLIGYAPTNSIHESTSHCAITEAHCTITVTKGTIAQHAISAPSRVPITCVTEGIHL